MATAARRGIGAAASALLLLALGAGAAYGVDVAIGPIEVDTAVALDPDRDFAMAWCARVLLWLGVSWLVIGMVSARTRLVRRPGAAAARASWIAATRPWRARESTLGMLPLDRWLMIAVPAALLVSTRAVQTAFVGWVHVALVLVAWLVFAAVVRLVVGRRSPWPVIAAVGGVVVLRCILTLAALSFAGPGGLWVAFWTDPVRRSVYLTVAVALFVWGFVAAGWALTAQLGARRATGAVLAAVGAGLALTATVVAVIGVESALAAGTDEPGLWAPGMVAAVAARLDVRFEAPWLVAAAGGLVALIGALLALPTRRGRSPR